MKRRISTFVDEEGVTFDMTAEVIDGVAKASVKGTIDGVTTVDGTFESGEEKAEELLGAFLDDSFNAHYDAIVKARGDDVKESTAKLFNTEIAVA
jgi:hypothetical protein